MNRKFIVAILVIAAAPVCVQAQKPTPVTKADAQNVLKIISGDKAKSQAYCEIAKLGDQMEQANEKRDSKKFDELSRKMDELAKTLGAEYAALMDGLPDIDPGSEDGKEIASTFDELDKLCGR
jgi:peptidoglycan hydrolase CwlO-like protein